MDANRLNAQDLQQAVQVIRDRLGERIEGGLETGTTAMRKALQEGMDISENQADVLVKHLQQTRGIIYRGAEDVPGADTEPVVPLPRDNMGAGGGALYFNQGHGLTSPMAGVILNENDERNSPSLLSINEQGYWLLADADDSGGIYTQPRGPAGEYYDQPNDTNSYAADLDAAGRQQDADARRNE